MMDEFRFKRLEEYQVRQDGDEMELAFPAPRTPNGMVYRHCPNEDCTPRHFLLGDAPESQVVDEENHGLVRREPGTEGVTCPYCGIDAEDGAFTHPDDVAAARGFVEWAAAQDMKEHFENVAEDFNRQVGGGPLGISMSVTGGPPRHRPYPWREDLLRSLTCDICGRQYGVYAIALFCPDCGGRNVHVHFGREVQLVGEQIDLSQNIENEGKHELAYRLLGNAHEDVLTAFETYLKTIYRFLVGRRLPEQAEALLEQKAIGNSFQNLERTKRLFGSIGLDPFDGITDDRLGLLQLNIEKRHVVGHNLSLSDEKYSESTMSEEPGKAVQLLGEDIRVFADICRCVVAHLETSSDEFLPSGGNDR